MDDLISRREAVDAIMKLRNAEVEHHGKVPCKGYWELTAAIEMVKSLPSAQPELPEWAQKVEEYRQSAPSFVRNQLVWALYQTWKDYDGRLVHQRGKENR